MKERTTDAHGGLHTTKKNTMIDAMDGLVLVEATAYPIDESEWRMEDHA